MREYLKGLGFTEEQIEGVMAEHGKAMAKAQDEIKKQKEQAGKAPGDADYEKLYAEDGKLRDFVDKRAAGKAQADLDAALAKQRRLADEALSEAERLKEMTADERAKYRERKARDAAKAAEREHPRPRGELS
jgi:hypothetical protein